ncbi:DUF262 domain-containing protein [Pontibacter actiniarum]|uniref:GmrSD restriction endonucleases N-terminal domain-containing protein n=1 Tax=Pontibacter actiniarum TaxID=323450 RepID=A0A1X9YQK6_9BACT|nr:DUF262 domain-containing protein [Pontibacter actiniarum]ARS35148.1 hypothetical protein CA264_06645 [Pontibacter actiniarum]
MRDNPNIEEEEELSYMDLQGILNDNEEIADDLELANLEDTKVYSRDWTIGTIYDQIDQQNIDLNPDFQRRNAWDDARRSRLIESLIVGYPVPEVVLAEDLEKRRSFLVIDGKQRLLTIAGFINPQIPYWNKPILTGLKVRKDLNGLAYQDLISNPAYTDVVRSLKNADLRCTVISSYRSNDVLYNIFHRLNTGSVPLATQELRQVLFRGPFSNYLIAITNDLQPIHSVLGLKGPDHRLRDVEIILRYLAICFFGNSYAGNLKKFLDDSMKAFNLKWNEFNETVEGEYQNLNNSLFKLENVFGRFNRIGRKYTENKLEPRFNRVLFEVQVFYFRSVPEELLTEQSIAKFTHDFQLMCNAAEFRSSIEATTKTKDSYFTRFSNFETLINSVFDLKLNINPFVR